MPNDMDRAYNAWTGRKATALRRHVLDCGHPKRDDVYYHLWCDRLSCSPECAEAEHDCELFKGKSSIEEEAAPVEDDAEATRRVALRRRSPEDRAAYFAARRAELVADGASVEHLAAFDALAAFDGDTTIVPADQFDELMATIDAPDEMPGLQRAHERRHPTLAEMNEASAAVRARQGVRGRVEPDGPIHPGPGTFLPLGEVYLRPGAEPQAYWPDPSVTFAVDVSTDGTGAVAVRDSNGHVHLAEVSPPVDAALDHADDRPWWRRILGGDR